MSTEDTISWTPTEQAALDELGDVGGEGRLSILIVHEHLPRYDASGSDLRLLQLCEAYAGAGHRVTLIGRNDLGVAKYRETLEHLGIETLAPDPERLFWAESDEPRIDLPRLFAERRFDVAILFHWYWSGVSVTEQYLPELRRHSPATRLCVLTDDVHWLRELRRSERREQGESGRAALERSRALKVKERAAYSRADLLLTITDADASRIAVDHPGLPMANVSFCQSSIPEQVPGYDERADLLFLGSGVNDANACAVAWFVEDCLPEIRRRLPSVSLRIVGEPPPARDGKGGWAGGGDGVIAVGRVEELEPHLAAARVFVSPVTYGTGLKTKNIQALGSGLPQVLTSISAEGMQLEGAEGTGGTGDAEGAFVRDDPAAFVDAVVALYTERERWERASLAALEHARAHFSRERVIRDCTNALRAVLAIAPRAFDARLDAIGLPEEVRSSRARQPMARVYDAHMSRARRFKAAECLEEARHELRLALCAFCCWPPQTPVLGEIHTLLASHYLAGEQHEEALAAAEEALSHPHVAGRTREVLESIRALCTVARSAAG